MMAAVLLSSCGKQEAVGDVPSSEELAKRADAATAAVRDEAAANDADKKETAEKAETVAMISYTNALRGFSVMLPKNWVLDEEASDDNGRVYQDKEAGIALTVGWSENSEDADMKAAISTIEKAGDAMTGGNVNENEYRASGKSGEDQLIDHRILRKADGTMISAKITYPAGDTDKINVSAKRVIDSLALTP